ncbi:CHAT domain-containing tetratricopeptide repeat protein [Pyxidicoccus sp. MSG2]|uniref:CHAT domain-containing tetratricopeptide repeat protein n=1 Tax=Pyxidicoccus sp. MSG2 TaxID=2996790 RepID=UPI00227084FF|nr:CHAT domain-containing tetratricopeptide repeat protein [Pyxidicoccus sp. MSG2]MCY1019472.1 CHAT domain-containing protein [Pyxidicoccus sp. MSG2]
MWRVRGGAVVVILCCLAGLAAVVARPDARLLEARAVFDEAARLEQDGRYIEAIPASEHALALRAAALGDTHPEVAVSLDQLGHLLMLSGDSVRPGPLLQRALDIQQAVLAKHHPELAQTLTHLAILHDTQGHTAQAESLFERALEATQGASPIQVANALDNLAVFHASQRRYPQAEREHLRARAILEAELGPHHPDVARAYSNLARVYSAQGLHARAEPLYQQALAILETSLGRNHPEVARALNRLGRHYATLGLETKAEPLHARALAIQQAALGANHPEVADTLSNLARLYSRQGQDARAEPLHRRALDIRLSTFGENHPDVAWSLHSLGSLYSRQGRYELAGPLLWQALLIEEAALGQEHPDLTCTLNNLGLFHAQQGHPDRAEPFLRRALDIQQTALGPNHPDVAQALDNLAWVLVAQDRHTEAVPLLLRSLEISEEFLRREAPYLSESHLSSFFQRLRENEERLHALRRAHPSDASVQRLAFTSVLLRKGRSAEELAARYRAIHDSLDPGDRDALQRLRELRSELAELSFGGPRKLSPNEYRQRMKDVANRGDALEAALATRSAPLRALTARVAPADLVDQVAAVLPLDSALLEWVAYRDLPRVTGGLPSQSPGQLRYLALLLFPDGSIRAVDLGPGDRIDSAVTKLYEALAWRDSEYRLPSRALYLLTVQPLLPLPGQVRRLVLAPDGQLGQVSFEALHDGQHYLLDRFELSYVISGRDLLPRARSVSPASSVAVFAPSFASTRSAGEEVLASLPGTREEALSIQRQFPGTRLYLGPEATKQNLFQLLTPGILHIAAHGSFNQNEGAAEGTRALGHFGGLHGGAPRLLPDDPLLRSSLILSDVRGGRGDSSRATALEVAGLDLWGTQLVVMSACESGRGDVTLGEGILGLRRAFLIAGAETVVMSLWKVNDDSTRLLMGAYYRHLRAGRGRTEALHLAMREVRETHPHPYYWAPFISVGRDTPLQLTPSIR